MITGCPLSIYKTVNWKTGPARARYNLELKKNKKIKKKVRAQASKRSSAKVLTTEEYKILWDKYNVKERSN